MKTIGAALGCLLATFAVLGGCSSSSSDANPAAGNDAGTTSKPSADAGSTFCDDYGRQIGALGCGGNTGESFAAICKQVSASEGACRAAYEAVLSCQPKTAQCVDGKIQFGTSGCEKEESAYSACKTGTPQPEAGAACTTLALGADVQVEQVAQDFAAPTAGLLLADGTYELSSVVVYTGTGGATGPGPKVAVTMKIAGAGYELIAKQEGSTTTSAGSLAVNADQLTFQQTCPTNEDIPFGFTQKDADTLEIYDAPKKSVETYRRK